MDKAALTLCLIVRSCDPLKHALRIHEGAALSFSDRSDPTRNRNFRAFWRSRDPFFRDAAITLPPIPAATPVVESLDTYKAFLNTVRHHLKREDAKQ